MGIKNVPLGKKALPNRRNLEIYKPGANRALVLDALKKVAKTPKPSPKNGEQPDSASS